MAINHRYSETGLSARQRELFNFIHASIIGGGICPSYQVMASFMNIKSKSIIHGLIMVLVKKGYIEKSEHRAGSIVILKELDREPVLKEIDWCKLEEILRHARSRNDSCSLELNNWIVDNK